MASKPVPADGSRTRSADVSAAAAEAARPSAIGVENCCKAWLSAERRVWVGSNAAIFERIGSWAEGGRARRAGAILRRNRTVAASQAS